MTRRSTLWPIIIGRKHVCVLAFQWAGAGSELGISPASLTVTVCQKRCRQMSFLFTCMMSDLCEVFPFLGWSQSMRQHFKTNFLHIFVISKKYVPTFAYLKPCFYHRFFVAWSVKASAMYAVVKGSIPSRGDVSQYFFLTLTCPKGW